MTTSINTFDFSAAFTPIALRKTGQRRGPEPPEFCPAAFTLKNIFVRPFLPYPQFLVGGGTTYDIAIGLPHPPGILPPPLPMVPAPIAGVEDLMGQYRPAAFLRSFRHSSGHFNTKASLYIFEGSPK